MIAEHLASLTKANNNEPELSPNLALAPLRDEHIRPAEKIGLALNYIAKSDIPVGLFMASNLRVLPTEQVRRVALAGDLLAYKPAFIERVSLTGCRVLLLHEFARLITPRRSPEADSALYEIACDLWLNSELRAGYRQALFDVTSFREEFMKGPLRAIGLFAGESPCESAPQAASLQEVYDWVVIHQGELPPGVFEPAFAGEIQYADPGKFADGHVYKTDAVMNALAENSMKPPPENPRIQRSDFANARLGGREREFLLGMLETLPSLSVKSLGLLELLQAFPSDK
jgi:hypothetical protein